MACLLDGLPVHGKELRFAKPDTWGEPDAVTSTVTERDQVRP